MPSAGSDAGAEEMRISFSISAKKQSRGFCRNRRRHVHLAESAGMPEPCKMPLRPHTPVM